jgi:hypothetical protein
MASAWRLLVWFVAVETLITIFGVTTAPLLLAVAADTVVVFLIIRSCLDMRAAPVIELHAIAPNHHRKESD